MGSLLSSHHGGKENYPQHKVNPSPGKQVIVLFHIEWKILSILLIPLLAITPLSFLGLSKALASPQKSGFTTYTLYIEPNGSLFLDDFYTADFSDDDGFVINLARTDGRSLQGDNLSARMKIYQPFTCNNGFLYMTSATNPLENYQGGTFTNTQPPDFTYVTANGDWSEWINITAGAFYGLIIMRGKEYTSPGCGTQITLEVKHNAGTQPPPPSYPPEASFWADDYDITVPNCTYLRWETSNAIGVTLDYDTVSLNGSQYVCPTTTTTYRLDVFGENGQSTLEKVTIQVQSQPPPPKPAPSISFWSDNNNISNGQCTTLRWDISNASTVTLENVYEEANGAKQVCPNQTTTYVIRVNGVDGKSYSQSVTVNVSTPSANIIFFADDDSLKSGECTTLNWDTNNASRVSLEGEEKPLSGSQQVCPTQDKAYTLEVVGVDGKVIWNDVTILVEKVQAQPSTVLFYADQTRLQAGECTVLHWSTSNVLGVELDDEPENLTGDRQVCPNESTSYVLDVRDQQGQGSYTVTIEVLEKEEVKPEECQDISNNILIVTHSRNLNESTGSAATWEDVRDMLEEYYGSAAGQCVGLPVFLDLDADVGGSFSDFKEADRAIETYISQHFSGDPGAIVIIGGPNVIPYGEIYVTNDFLDPVLTDDLYADFDHDEYNLPDTVITRLPDGHSRNLLIQYITRLSQNPQPPAGSTMLIPLQKAYERLADPNPLILRTVTGQGQQTSSCYLEDYLQSATGSNTLLMSPPWIQEGGSSLGLLKDYIPSNDPANQKGLQGSNISSEITKRDVVFVGQKISEKSRWTVADREYSHLFGVNEARSLPKGAHVFAMVGFGADLTYWAVGETTEDSIPLAMLEANAHHFIGTTDEVFTANLSTTLPKSGTTPLSSLDVNQYDLAFAKTYFSTNCSRMGAAANFFNAKINFAVGHLQDPTYQKSLHAYIYYGLPEKLGTTEFSCRYMDQPVCTPSDRKSNLVTGDMDGDGLPQVEENWIANTFKPYYVLDVDEPTAPPKFMYQVTPFDKLPHYGVPGVVLTIVSLYSDDISHGEILPINKTVATLTFHLSEYSLLWHHGDNEVIEIWLSQSQSACNGQWEHLHQSSSTCYSLQRLVTHRHGETLTSDVRDIRYEFANNEFASSFMPGLFGTHVVLYVSQGKHASYFNEGYDCDGRTYQGSACGTIPILNIKACLNKCWEICSSRQKSEAAGRAILPYFIERLNVGEANQPLIEQMSDNYFLTDFPFENAWGKEQFCGGYRQTGGGNEDVMLPQGALEAIKMSLSKVKILFWTIPELPTCGGINYDHWCGVDKENDYCGRNFTGGEKGIVHVE